MSETATLQTVFCPECGRKVAADEKFCRGCGKPLQEQPPAGNDAQNFPATAVASAQAKSDPLLAVRVVLLIGAGISAFTAPMFITLILGVAWLVVMVLPRKSQ